MTSQPDTEPTDRIPIKINKARTARCPYCLSADGIEMRRHVAKGRWLLFLLLFPLSLALYFLLGIFADHSPHCITCGKEL
jgi:hypothetical protein